MNSDFSKMFSKYRSLGTLCLTLFLFVAGVSRIDAQVRFDVVNSRTNETSNFLEFLIVGSAGYTIEFHDPTPADVALFTANGVHRPGSDLVRANDVGRLFYFDPMATPPGFVEIAPNVLGVIHNGTSGRYRVELIDDDIVEFNEDILVTVSDDLPSIDFGALTIEYDEVPAGGLDLGFSSDPPYDDRNPTPGANNHVFAMEEQFVAGQRRIYLGGAFTAVNSVPVNRITRLLDDGSVDTSFQIGLGVDGLVNRILSVGDDDDVYAIGSFSAYDSNPSKGVVRINGDGSYDNGFFVGSGADQIVHAIDIHRTGIHAGKVVVGGEFSSFDGRSAPFIVRLLADGRVDDTFSTGAGPNGRIFDLDIQSDGKIVIGGEFTSVDGVNFNRIARLTESGAIDLMFNPGAGLDDTVFDIDLASDSKIVVGGGFRTADFLQASRIVRLNADGSVDTDFNSGGGFDNTVYSVELQNDGRLLVGGVFHEFNSVGRTNVARLFESGALDTSFMDSAYNLQAGTTNSSAFAGSAVKDVVAQTDGSVLIGGVFTDIGGSIGLLGNGLENTGIVGIGTSAGRTWAVEGLNPAGGNSAGGRRIQLGGNGNTRYGTRPRRNFARLEGGSTPTDGNVDGGPGNVNFVFDRYAEDEEDGNFVIEVTRANGRLGPVLADLSSLPSTASANVDYQAVSDTASWPNGFGQNGIPMHSSGNLINKIVQVPIIDDQSIEGDENLFVSLTNPRGSFNLPPGSFYPPTNIVNQPAVGFVSDAELTILDDDFDFGTVDIASTNFFVSESDSEAVITVVRSGGDSGLVTVQYSTTTGTALAGSDYLHLTNTLTFLPGVKSATVRVPILNDTSVEFDEYFNFSISNPNGGATLGSKTSALVVIHDDDLGVGSVAFTTNAFNFDEDSMTVMLELTRSSGSAGTVSVDVSTADGTASSGTHYNALVAETVTFIDGQLTAFVPITIQGNSIPDGDVFFNVVIDNPVGGGIGITSSATVTMVNNDSYGQLQFSASGYAVNEQSKTIEITVVRYGGSQGEIMVNYATAPAPFDTASQSDFVGNNGTLTFGDGVTSQSFTVTISDDAILEGDEKIALDISSPVPAGQGILGNIQTAIITIIDDESRNLPAGSRDTSFDTGFGPNDFVLSADIQDDGRIVVGGNFSSFNGKVREGLTRINPSGLLDNTFEIGTGANDRVNDVIVRDDGKVLAGGSFTAVNGTNRIYIARLNTDGKVDRTFDPGSGPDNPILAMAESPDGQVVVVGNFTRFNNVSRNKVALLAEDGRINTTFDSTVGANGVVRTAAIHTNGLHTGKVVIGGDFTTYGGLDQARISRLNLADGQIDLTFAANVGTAFSGGSIHRIVIQEDGKILVGGRFETFNGVSRLNLLRLNGDGSLDSSFLDTTTNADLGFDNTVYAIAIQDDEKIVVGGDFTAFDGVGLGRIGRLNSDGSFDTTINFGRGANSFISDIDLEKDEKILISGGFTTFDNSPALYLTRLIGNTIVTNTYGRMVFESAEYTAIENQPAATVTLKRVGGVAEALSIDWDIVAGGTALENVDYTVPVNRTVTFANGQATAAFTIPLLNDLTLDNGKTINLALSNPMVTSVGGVMPSEVIGSRTQAVLTINDDDSIIQFSQPTFSATEASRTANISIVRENSTEGDVLLEVYTTNITAEAGLDYVGFTNLVTFENGETEKSITVELLEDLLVEPVEVFQLGLNLLTAGPQLGMRSNAFFNIDDNEFSNGELVFSADEYLGNENQGGIRIDVFRLNGNSGVISVNFETMGSTATDGVDFVSTNGVLSFADGETNKYFEVTVLPDDLTAEQQESLTVNLANPLGGAVLGAQSVSIVSINNNNSFRFGGFSFANTNLLVSEAGGNAAVQIDRAGLNEGEVSVEVRVSAGTATEGADFQAFTNTVIFADGVSQQTVMVPIIDEIPDLFESPETINIQLANPTGGAELAVNSVGLITVIDNDSLPGEFSFSAGIFQTNETSGTATITVIRTNGIAGAVSVDYATSAGSAVEGEDYSETNGTLNFAAGVTNQQFQVTLSPNTAQEGTFTVNLTLSNPLGGASITGSEAVLMILDNEPSAGSVSVTFVPQPGTDDVVYSASVLPATGGIYIGGDFKNVEGLPREGVARLLSDGRLDTGFDSGVISNNLAAASVRAVSVYTNGLNVGQVVIGGSFSSIGGTQIKNLARLLPTGSVDPSFNIGIGVNNRVNVIRALNDGNVLLGGAFTSVNGTTRSYLVRLTSTGAIDPSFNVGSGPDGEVKDLYVDNQNRVVIAGAFTRVNGVLSPGVARLLSSGVVDKDFDIGLGASGTVESVSPRGNSGMVIGGSFLTFDGDTNAVRLAVLSTTGGLDPSYVHSTYQPNDLVKTVSVAPEGSILIGGGFTALSGTTNQNRVVRLTSTGELDPSFNLGEGANDFVSDLVRLGDGSYIIVGAFTLFDREVRHGYVKVNAGSNVGVGFVEFALGSYSTPENASAATVTVARKGALNGTLSVNYETQESSALDTVHYTGQTGTIFFAEGENSKTISIPIIDDANAFQDVSFNVLLHTGVLVQLTNNFLNLPLDSVLGSVSNATVNILDNDSVVGFSSSLFAVDEGDGSVSVTVERAGSSIESINVDYASVGSTNSSSATVGSDYLPVMGTFTFLPGETQKQFVVPILEETRLEKREFVDLVLSNAVGNVSFGLQNSVVAIEDNDGAAGLIRFAATNYISNEGDGVANVTLIRTQGLSGIVSARVTVSPVTAVVDSDFFVVTNSFTFADGESSKVFQIPLIDDQINEPLETALLSLDGVSGGASLLGDYPDGELDEGFNFGLSPTGGAIGPNSRVNTVATLADNSVIAGGAFTSVTTLGQTYSANRIVKFDANGFIDVGFPISGGATSGANGEILVIEPLRNGQILVGGNFTNFNTNAYNRLVRIDSFGNVDTNFNIGAGASEAVFDVLELRGSGDYLVAGAFNNFRGVAAQGLIRLNASGTIETGFFGTNGVGNAGVIFALAEDAFGRIYIGGSFGSYHGSNSVNNLTRLLPNGRIDTTFNLNTRVFPNRTVFAIGVDPFTQQPVVGGNFSGFTSTNVPAPFPILPGLARYQLNGFIDPTFEIGTGVSSTIGLAQVVDIHTYQSGNQIGDLLIAGRFESVNGTPRNNISRLNSNGSVDLAFEPGIGFDNTVGAIAVDSFNNVVTGGDFLNYDGQEVQRISRLLAGQTLGLTNSVLTIVDNDIDLGFTNAVLSVSENNGTLVVEVIRRSNPDEALTVFYETSDGTVAGTDAIEGFDYMGVNGFLTFAAGVSNMTFQVGIIDDSVVEQTESFHLTLSNFSGKSLVGTTTTEVQIINDDSSVDLVVGQQVSDPIYANGPFTLTYTVSNAGESGLQGVVVTNQLPAGVTAIASPESFTLNGSVLTFDLGALMGGETKEITVTGTAPASATLTNTVFVTAQELVDGLAVDVDSSNNLSLIPFVVRSAQPFFDLASFRLVSEGLSPDNGAIDPGETVTLGVVFKNSGNQNSNGDVTASLQSSSSVQTGTPSSANLGAIASSASSTEAMFQFTASGTNGQKLVANFAMQDSGGLIHSNIVSLPFTLGSGGSGTNDNAIVIPLQGMATPYPSTIQLSGLTGLVSRVSVTLSNLNHGYSDDLDVLLVGPNNQGAILMSDVGGGNSLTGITLRIEDGADDYLPNEDALSSGTFKPVNYHTRSESPDVFESPAPSGVYATNLKAFNGIDPNGAWSLYVMDDSILHSGGIQGGWNIDISTVFTLNETARLKIEQSSSTNSSNVGTSVQYTYVVENTGATTATGITLTNQFPSEFSFTSVNAASGTVTVSGSQLTIGIPDLTGGQRITNVVNFAVSGAGELLNTVSVGGGQTDPFPGDNISVVEFSAVAVADLVVTADAASGNVGQNVTNLFVVSNSGPSTAVSPQFSVNLPSGLTVVSSSGPFGTLVQSGSRLSTPLPNLPAGSSVTVQVVTSASGSLTGGVTIAASVNSPTLDLVTTNNLNIPVSNVISSVANLGVSIITESPVVPEGTTVIYEVTVSNSGPSTATGVVLSNAITAGNFDPSGSSPGCVFANGVVTCNVGGLNVGASQKILIAINYPAVAGPQAAVVNVVNVSSAVEDLNSLNNQQSVTVGILDTADIVAAGATITSESISPANGSIDPGETVTVSLRLENVSGLPVTSINAELLTSGGITPVVGTANYNPISKTSGPVGREFTFTAANLPGAKIKASLRLTDASNNAELGVVSYEFNLGLSNGYSNPSMIQIPVDQVEMVGKSGPYPSEVIVSNLDGTISAITVTLNDLNHSFASDLDIVLVSPNGNAGVVLMSDAGGTSSVDGYTLTFDDSAATQIPSGRIGGSGVFRPANYDAVDDGMPDLSGVTLSSALSSLAGMNPNGTWKLYIYDDSNGDSGMLTSGWSMQISTLSTVEQTANLGVTATVSPSSVVAGMNASYTITITNKGPNTALNVVATNLFSGTTVVDSFSGASSLNSTIPNAASAELGDIQAGGSVTWTLTVSPMTLGTLTNSLNVASTVRELDESDNSIQVLNEVVASTMNVGGDQDGAFMFQVQGRNGKIYVIEASSDLSNWTPISTNISLSEAITIIDEKSMESKERFYRAVEQ